MDSERSDIIEIPTELERGDAFVVLAMGFGLLFVGWWAIQRGVPAAMVILPSLIVVVWMFTSRSATEVRFIGGIAVLVRNKLGERDAHEWVLAWLHYIKLVHYPIWKAECVRLLKSAQQRLLSLRR